MEKEKLSSNYLNKENSALGISGVSSEFRDIEAAGRTIGYIGAYANVVNGVDAIVFTAGLGENSINDARSDSS
jgi:acetate kinase